MSLLEEDASSYARSFDGENKYRFLRLIQKIGIVIAFLWAAFWVLIALAVLNNAQQLLPTSWDSAWAVGLTIGFIGLIAAGGFILILAMEEMIQVFLDIEENTRIAVESKSKAAQA